MRWTTAQATACSDQRRSAGWWRSRRRQFSPASRRDTDRGPSAARVGIRLACRCVRQLSSWKGRNNAKGPTGVGPSRNLNSKGTLRAYLRREAVARRFGRLWRPTEISATQMTLNRSIGNITLVSFLVSQTTLLANRPSKLFLLLCLPLKALDVLFKVLEKRNVSISRKWSF